MVSALCMAVPVCCIAFHAARQHFSDRRFAHAPSFQLVKPVTPLSFAMHIAQATCAFINQQERALAIKEVVWME